MPEEYESKKLEVNRETVLNALVSIPESAWESARWPVISYAPTSLFRKYSEGDDKQNEFWKQVLNPDNFLNPNSETSFNPSSDFLFIIHSFRNPNGDDLEYKAITTPAESFVEDPSNLIVYGIHGFPCENRGGGEYPTLNDFWKDFYDRLSENDKDRYPIPGKEFRKNFVYKKFFHR